MSPQSFLRVFGDARKNMTSLLASNLLFEFRPLPIWALAHMDQGNPGRRQGPNCCIFFEKIVLSRGSQVVASRIA